MSVTSVRIEEALQQPLEFVAQEMRRSKTWVINEALREYLAHQKLEAQRWQDTLEALDDIRTGRLIDGDKVHAWLESWGTKKQRAAPSK